jgi:L-threonylcarbamoyladenylate synthase
MTRVLGTDPASIRIAARCLRDGGLVAFPTETVYGLGVHALDPAAVRRLFAAKGRPANDPLIVHVTGLDAVAPLTTGLSAEAAALGDRFWPGPLTIVIPRAPAVPREVTAGLDTVAVRVPSHPVAHALLVEAGVPVAAPSANLFSRPSPTTAQHVLADLNGRIDFVVDGGPTEVGVESTVIDLTSTPPRLLRPGGTTLEQIRTVLPSVVLGSVRVGDDEAAPSPGLPSRHYSPRTPLVLVTGTPSDIQSAIRTRLIEARAAGRHAGVLAMREQAPVGDPDLVFIDLGTEQDPGAVARRLYAALREIDQLNLDLVFAPCPARTDGLWGAIADRLQRAATEQMAAR